MQHTKIFSAETLQLINSLIISIEIAEKKLQLLPQPTTRNHKPETLNSKYTTCNPPAKKQQLTQ